MLSPLPNSASRMLALVPCRLPALTPGPGLDEILPFDYSCSIKSLSGHGTFA